MSRGYGAAQRWLLARLADEPVNEHGYADWYYLDRLAEERARACDANWHRRPYGDPTAAEIESLRRAANRLVREGKLELGHGWRESRWRGERLVLLVRRSLTNEERASYEVWRAEVQRREAAEEAAWRREFGRR